MQTDNNQLRPCSQTCRRVSRLSYRPIYIRLAANSLALHILPTIRASSELVRDFARGVAGM